MQKNNEPLLQENNLLRRLLAEVHRLANKYAEGFCHEDALSFNDCSKMLRALKIEIEFDPKGSQTCQKLIMSTGTCSPK